MRIIGGRGSVASYERASTRLVDPASSIWAGSGRSPCKKPARTLVFGRRVLRRSGLRSGCQMQVLI